MLKVPFKAARAAVKIVWDKEGSVLAGTLAMHCRRTDIHLEIDSDEDPARIAALIRAARAGCPAEAMLSQKVEVSTTASLNNAAFDYESLPRVER